MLRKRAILALIYSLLIISSISNSVLTLGSYQSREERDNIIQRRPTVRTMDDNFIIETPRNRNITLSPGDGGFVRIGNTVIDPSGTFQNAQQSLKIMPGAPGQQGLQGARGPKGDPGSPDTATDLLQKLKSAGIDLHAILAEIEALKQKTEELEMYSFKGTYPALLEFYNNKYGSGFNGKKFGRSGVMVMTEGGGILLGQHITASGLNSGTSYAITFYLESSRQEKASIAVEVAGSDQTKIYINDRLAINCGDGDATFDACKFSIPPGKFKLTLVCSDSSDVLESIGFDANWLAYNTLRIDWSSLNKVLRNLPKRKK